VSSFRSNSRASQDRGPGGPGLEYKTFRVGAVMTLLRLTPPSPGAKEHASAETKRKRMLFAWANTTLEQLGFIKRIADAGSFDELRKVTFDPDAGDIELAIRDALHPASGRKADHLDGTTDGMLKRHLKKCFDERKNERREELKSGRGAGGAEESRTYNWTKQLKLNVSGGVRPILANLIVSRKGIERRRFLLVKFYATPAGAQRHLIAALSGHIIVGLL
jgi:hypothetical protein